MRNGKPAARLLDEFAYRLLSGERNNIDVSKLLRDLTLLDERARDGEAIANIGLYVETAHDLTSAGFPQLAERVARMGLHLDPGSTSMSYEMALALARLGSSARAARLLDELIPRLRPEQGVFVEALSLRGRLFKDAALRAGEVAIRERLFGLAAVAYERASQANEPHFARINAAAMRLMCGNEDAARAHANAALSSARADVDRNRHNFWTAATLGEASLILGDLSAASDFYLEAVARSAGRRGDLAAMHRQLKMLSRCRQIPANLMSDTSVGPVLLYTGHRADAANATTRRMGPETEHQVAAAIRECLDELRPSVVIGSAASGVDTMLLEEAERKGYERHIWLPLDIEQFVARSVADGGPQWVERFQRVIARATRVVQIPTETTSNDSISFVYLREIVLGAGLLEADRLATSVRGFAVTDPAAGIRPGGSADTAARWRSAGLKVRTLSLERPDRSYVPSEIATEDRCLRAMLFSDMGGYSAMAESNVRAFPKHFLSLVRELLDANPGGIDFSNTWGDGVFLGFERWDVAARFALDLRDRVADTDWAGVGLPTHTSVRMGMHTGPIFREVDPVLKRENYFGSHVVRAARLEPIAAPGAIWLTEEMACLLASMRTSDMTCEFLGQMPLAKGYGKSPLYALERGNNWLNQQA